jgi:hypothetical protein
MAHVRVPVRMVGTVRWGALHYMADTHDICGEKVDCIDQKYSFAGQHRVRLYRFKKNVHWRIPIGVNLDIADVPPAEAPRRQHHR